MSATTQLPVYGEVCVKTEQQVIGYRDLTNDELSLEEMFSSNVPTTFGDSLDENFTGIIGPNTLPGVVIGVPNGPEYTPPSPVPIPGSIWLFAAALACYLMVKGWRKEA